MPDEAGLFQTKGASWGERAHLGEFNAVLSPTADLRSNLFLHGVSLFAAQRALRYAPRTGDVLDFGCGNGRLVRFFGARGCKVVGTEVTREMVDAAHQIGVPPGSRLHVTDGIHVPEPDHAFDLIWCCGVLRYSLFVPNPVYDQITREFARVLRPGGRAVVVEMYVDTPPDPFMTDFQMTGFRLQELRVLNRYWKLLERILRHRMVPTAVSARAGRFGAFSRYYFDRPGRAIDGLRDYLFVWEKPL